MNAERELLFKTPPCQVYARSGDFFFFFFDFMSTRKIWKSNAVLKNNNIFERYYRRCETLVTFSRGRQNLKRVGKTPVIDRNTFHRRQTTLAYLFIVLSTRQYYCEIYTTHYANSGCARCSMRARLLPLPTSVVTVLRIVLNIVSPCPVIRPYYGFQMKKKPFPVLGLLSGHVGNCSPSNLRYPEQVIPMFDDKWDYYRGASP